MNSAAARRARDVATQNLLRAAKSVHYSIDPLEAALSRGELDKAMSEYDEAEEVLLLIEATEAMEAEK